MSKNERKRAGLHKEISSIFKGVVIPQREAGRESSGESIPARMDHTVPKQIDAESKMNEVTKPCQAVQTLPDTEPVQESKAESIEEFRAESVEQPKAESFEEPKVEPVEESKAEPVQEFKAESVEQPKVEPVEESKVEPAHTPKFLTAQESSVVPVRESEIESFEGSKSEPAQETKKDKPVSPPKFLTAQESRVIPIQESEVEPTQETKDKSVSSPKFLTAQESELKPAKESENEPANKSKLKKAEKPKVIPVQESKKTGIKKISKRISKKRPVVKVGSESSWKHIKSKLFAAKPGASTTKQKAMVVIVPVLFIVLVIFVLKGGVFGTSVHNVEAGQGNNASDVASPGSSSEIDWEIPEPYPTTLRDPVQLGPVVTGTNQTESGGLVQLIVKGILYSEDNPSAIVGNRIVHEGDKIQDARVIKINKESVEFEMGGKKWTQKVQR